ncbi:MAG TPA: class I SAM-dependent methyltransferase [Candidatus Eisenbergiella merdipullorum]|uniref:Class I SAM-dependent methyltransferase n=1 Tax=Candidatus Eisenbergiella merdipullorum TaxID=2838553 RepID=A0A9D2L1I2_9FIRM|nr:class I SAM-dependent methyltransferase [Candidatus Eisenbergiella merdipullorum]
MTRVQKIVRNFLENIKGQDVLEAACGCAEFSVCASAYARSVHCIDLTNSRLLDSVAGCPNLTFQIMDAADMFYPSGTFDTAVLYNAVAHLGIALEQVLEECLRVLRSDGVILMISSFKMDKNVIHEDVIPFLERNELIWESGEVSPFLYVKIWKDQ